MGNTRRVQAYWLFSGTYADLTQNSGLQNVEYWEVGHEK